MIKQYTRFTLKAYFTFSFLLFTFLLHAQFGENARHDNISGKLRTYSILNAPEKVYLHTDKEVYSNGETIWFKTYLVDGVSHKKSGKSGVVYVDLLNQKDSVLAHRKLYSEGIGASGDIEIDPYTIQGTYRLRAYTQFMLNETDPVLFEKPIFISNTQLQDEAPEAENGISDISENDTTKEQQQLSARFFPEGGDMVGGLLNYLGFEIKDAQGNGISKEGDIVEGDGTIVSYFKSHEFGLGVFNFVPEARKQYFAVIEHEGVKQKFALPVALENGHTLHVKNKGDHLVIRASSTARKGLEGVFLVGHLRGDVFFEHHIKRQSSRFEYIYKLSTERLSDGVAHFTLFSGNGEPLCERLVFVDNPDNDAVLNITTSEDNLGYRSPVDVNLEILNNGKDHLEGELSLSVFQVDNALAPEQAPTNIKTWLLLNSDVGGSVENPGYFFEDDSGYRKRLLDALMLTHGWRRFAWKEFLLDSVDKVARFSPEKGIMINGKATAYNNAYQPMVTEVQLTFPEKGVYQENQPTDAMGKFSFGPFFFQDTIAAVVENMVNKEGSTIFVDPSRETVVSVATSKSKWDDFAKFKRVSRIVKSNATAPEIDFKLDPKVTRLKEVKVIGEQKSLKQLVDEQIDGITALYSEPSNRIFVDSVRDFAHQSAIDLLRLVPGVSVEGAYPNETVQIRGPGSINSSGSPLFLFDGAPVSLSFIQFLRASEVLFVDVLKDNDAAIFGVRGANGVIAFYGDRTLNLPAEVEQSPGWTNVKVPGFYKAREFYAPDYSMEKPEHKDLDYRTTLHWEPKILLNGEEEASLRLFTGDTAGEYLIRVEGMTTEGQPVFQMSKIVVDGYNTWE